MRRRAWFSTTLGTLLLGLAVCSINCPAVLAQVPDTVTQHVVDMWQEDAGLPQNYVSAILQSRDGYIWVGTRSGVARFDGVRFTTYDDLHPGQLKESEVWALAEDDERALWAGTYGGGLSRIAGGRITTYGTADGLPSDLITALENGRDGTLWVGTIAGLARREGGRFRQYGPQQGFPNVSVRALLKDAAGVLWIGADDGLWAYSGGHFVNHSRAHPDTLAGQVAALASDPDGGLWLSLLLPGGGAGGLRLLKDGQVTQFTMQDGLASNIVLSIAVRRDGTLWAGTRRGLSRYTNGRFENYVSDVRGVGDRQMLERASLEGTSALAFDREGNLWFGTRLDGVGRLRESAFLRATALDTTGQDLDVRSVHGAPNGAMWIGTATDLRLLRGGGVTLYAYGPDRDWAADAMAFDGDGTLLVGSVNGLWRLRDGRLEPHPVAAARTLNIAMMFTARSGDVWLGTRDRGAYRLSRGSLTPFTAAEGLLGSQVRGIGEDAGGAIWVATRDGGVTRLREGRVRVFGTREGLSSPAAQALHVEDDGTVWVATRRGLNRIRGDRIASVTAAEGLPANYFYQVVDDGAGQFWLTYARGIVRVREADLNAVADGRTRTLTPVPLGLDSGMKSTTMTVAHQPTAWKAPDGRLWFATARGVEVIDPRRTRSNPLPPPVLVEELRLGHDAHPIVSGMKVRPTRAEISISYTGLSFVAPNRVLFKYRLEGFDPGWVDAGTRRVAYYANLPHGRYRFRVVACNNDGIWNEAGASFAFEVLPRWHERLSVRILGIAAIGLALIGLFRARVSQLKRRERDLAARVDERTRELQELTTTLEQRVFDRTADLEQANEALSSERERLAVTLGSIADGVVATDVAGRVVQMNRAAEQIAGCALADAVGQPLHAVLHVLDRETRQPLLDAEPGQGLEAPFTPANPFLLRRPGGGEAVLSGSVAPIRDPRSRRVGTVFVFRDITERERIDEQLRNTQRLEALGVLAGGIAHDFNNLLTGVFGFVDVARDPETDPDHARDLLQRALGVIEKARGLTRQLLTFSKAGEPVRRPAALEPIVRSAAGFVLAGSNLAAEWRVAPGLWPCEVDERQVDQIVDNLLINARQAMPAGGTVIVEMINVQLPADPVTDRPAGPYVRLTVRDQGPGIPRELQARVLEPFFTTKPGGSGLGLATVYSIVRRHGGHLEIESEEGAGASFHVFLPAAPGESAVLRPPPPAADPARAPSSARVLVMDDEDYVRDVARQMLTRLGYDVLVAKDDTEAVGLLRAAGESGERVDVAILDITIPGGLGGAAALQRLREVTPGLPAIASSGYSGDTILARPGEHGFDGALPKPYTLANIRAVMATVLSAR